MYWFCMCIYCITIKLVNTFTSWPKSQKFLVRAFEIYSQQFSYMQHSIYCGLPRWLSGKESACQSRGHKRLKFDPYVWKIPLRGGHSNPLQYSCLENSTYRGAWQATAHGVTKSWTRLKWLSAHASIVYYNQQTIHYIWRIYSSSNWKFVPSDFLHPFLPPQAHPWNSPICSVFVSLFFSDSTYK